MSESSVKSDQEVLKEFRTFEEYLVATREVPVGRMSDEEVGSAAAGRALREVEAALQAAAD